MRGVQFLLCVCMILLYAGCAGTPRYAHSQRPPGSHDGTAQDRTIRPGSYKETGVASYYAGEFHGRKTASGERFDMNQLTAAHPKLPFGTRVRVTNLRNGLTVVVRINDRGPFKKSRIIDVSYAAAKKIGLLTNGSEKVLIEVVK